MAENPLDHAAQLAEQGNYAAARRIVRDVVQHDPNNVDAWWALAQLGVDDAERWQAVNRTLQLDPDHTDALWLRDQLKAGSHNDKNDKKVFAGRDFLPSAILVLFIYWVFMPAGLALNIYFLKKARELKAMTGQKQPNVGCLQAMLWVWIVPMAFGAILILLAVYSGLETSLYGG